MKKTRLEESAAAVQGANTAAPRTIFNPYLKPSETLAQLSAAAATIGEDAWDIYGEGGAVSLLEDEVRSLLGMEDAAFFPSGIMAQQVALRVHTDEHRTRRVALPDLSHLLIHEEDGPRIVHGFDYEMLTVGAQVPTRDALEAIPGPLGAVLAEIPLREAGCLLPSWEQLADFSSACAERGVPLHFDAARIWEAAPELGHSFAEIAGLADSVYVSFYKGLGAISGAVLAGDKQFISAARQWRRRLGGTVFHAAPTALSALLGLKENLPRIPDVVRWAGEFSALLPEPIRAAPEPIQTSQFLVYAPGDPAEANTRVAALTGQTGLAFSKPWRITDVPGQMMTELAIGVGSLDVTPEEAAALFAGAALGHLG